MDLNLLVGPNGLVCAALFGNVHEGLGMESWLRGTTTEIPHLGTFEPIGLPMDFKGGHEDWRSMAELSTVYAYHMVGIPAGSSLLPMVLPGAITSLAEQYGVLMATFIPLLAFADIAASNEWQRRVLLLQDQCRTGKFPFVNTVRTFDVTDACSFSCMWFREYLLHVFHSPLPSASKAERVLRGGSLPGVCDDIPSADIDEIARQDIAVDKFMAHMSKKYLFLFNSLAIEGHGYAAAKKFLTDVEGQVIEALSTDLVDRAVIVPPSSSGAEENAVSTTQDWPTPMFTTVPVLSVLQWLKQYWETRETKGKNPK